MSVPCPVCHEGAAPNEGGKCSACAALAVEQWTAGRVAQRHEDAKESADARRARLARMSPDDWRREHEGEHS